MVLVDMPYRTCFTETKETRDALAEYEYVTNSVISFLDEVLPILRKPYSQFMGYDRIITNNHIAHRLYR